MDFNLWWKFHHSHAALYPTNPKFKNLIMAGLAHLSCLKCTYHAQELFKRCIWSRNDAMLFKLHNNVNVRTHKPMVRWDYVKKINDKYTEQELFEIRWEFLASVFAVSLNKKLLISYLRMWLEFFNYDIQFNEEELLSNNRQFHIYNMYLTVGGKLPVQDVIYTK